MEQEINLTAEAEKEKQLEKFISKVDTEKVNSLKKEIEEYKKSLQGKEYAVSMNKEILNRFETFMRNEVEWKSKEALGVMEILKRIEAVKKEGIKDGVAYFTNLEVEASHYFILKWSGKGEKEINDFITLWKTFEETLMLIHQDNNKFEELKKELAAAEQGIGAE
jgi:GTPase involved in cell partitioning and DNA repair